MNIIYGKNPVMEALRAGRVKKVLLVGGLRDFDFVQQIKELAGEKGVPVALSTKEEIFKLVPKGVHQGIMAYVESLPAGRLDGLLGSLKDSTDALLLVLDGVIDPQNLGSLMRSAHAAGAKGIILRSKRATGLTPAAIKAAAGAAEYLPVVSVANLAFVIEKLKKHGFWVVGASERADKLYFEAELTGKLALVLGSEGKGLSRLVSEKCDFRVRVPMEGKISSLNVAVAGAVIMFEAMRQRQKSSG